MPAEPTPTRTLTRTLTFGDDGTPAADVAWLWLNSQPWPGWRLDVVTAQLPPAGPPPSTDECTLHEWTPPDPRAPFETTTFATVRHLTALADPRLALCRPSDLLVIGPRGPGLLKSLHLGSTADWLLLHPPAPLLIARHGHPVRSVVVCTDGSAHAVTAIEAFARLPLATVAEVLLLAVDDGRVDTGAALADAHRRLSPTGATLTTRVVAGSPTSAIHEVLGAVAPDLAVLGTRGLTGLRHLRVGSTASAVARASRCSVLVACED